MFDEIEERFLEKYRAFMGSSPLLDIMVKDQEYYAAFSGFLKSEEEYVAVIHKMGRSQHLLSKLERVWMSYYDVELSSSPKYRKAKDVIFPYVAGCTMIFFTNWVNDPTGFNIRENAVFSGKFIDRILSTEAEDVKAGKTGDGSLSSTS